MNTWQIVLTVVIGLILLNAAILLFGRAKIRIICREKVKVVASVLGIRFTLISDKDKKDRAKKDLSRCHNPDRVLKKEMRRRRRLAKIARKKKRKAAKRAAQHKKKKQEKKALQVSPNLAENLSMITALIKRLYAVTRGKLDIHIRKLQIRVGTDDAAKTAILYGAILQSAAYLLQWIDTHFAHIRRKAGDMSVEADYLSDKCHAEIDITCSLYLSQILSLAIKMLFAYRNEKARADQKAAARVRKARSAQQVEKN